MERNNDLEIEKENRNWISSFIKQLTERLQKMDEILVVDRIEDDIAVCENRNNGKMKNILLSELPEGVKEGSILKWNNDKYEIDLSNEIEQRIEKKMKDVWE